jgi:hypothetical protein
VPHQPGPFPEVKAAADKLYAELMAAGVDVMLDDRNERPGAMFADWELIGVPHRVTIGDRASRRQVEYQHRRDAAATSVARGDIGAGPASIQTAGDMSRRRPIDQGMPFFLLPIAGGLDCYRFVSSASWRPAGRAAGRFGAHGPEFGHCATRAAHARVQADTESRLHYLRWLGSMSERLKKKKPTCKPQGVSANRLVRKQACRAGVRLVLGLIQVESNFRKICGVERGRARLHAGDAVLDARAGRRRCWASCFTCRPICVLAV